MIIPREIGFAIQNYSEIYDLPANVVFGVCLTESALEPLSIRHEPYYRWLYDIANVKPYGCSTTTEKAMQKTSWGLMQVMGAVFREYGYRGWLSAIPGDIRAQIEYGCKHLASKIKRYGLEHGIGAYNSGKPIIANDGKLGNQQYIDRVMSAAKQW